MVDCFDPNRFRNGHSWVGTLDDFLTKTMMLDSLRTDLGTADFNAVMSSIKQIQSA